MGRLRLRCSFRLRLLPVVVVVVPSGASVLVVFYLDEIVCERERTVNVNTFRLLLDCDSPATRLGFRVRDDLLVGSP